MKNQTGVRLAVVATDFSADARAALRRVGTLPMHAKARIHLVHVIATPSLVPLAMAKDIAGERLRRDISSLRRRMPRVRVTMEITAGRPADELVRIASRLNAGLIVLGRRGAGGFPRLMLGSTAERLARLTHVPVLIVANAAASHKRALIAIDVDDDVAPLLRSAAALIPARASVELLHVYWVYGEGYLRVGGASAAAIRRHRTTVHEQAARQLAGAVETMQGVGVSVTAHLEGGDPRTQIPRAIRRRKPGLVVIGNHRRNRVARALLGSVAQEVLRTSGRDVLLIPI